MSYTSKNGFKNLLLLSCNYREQSETNKIKLIQAWIALPRSWGSTAPPPWWAGTTTAAAATPCSTASWSARSSGTPSWTHGTRTRRRGPSECIKPPKNLNWARLRTHSIFSSVQFICSRKVACLNCMMFVQDLFVKNRFVQHTNIPLYNTFKKLEYKSMMMYRETFFKGLFSHLPHFLVSDRYKTKH